jgi:hypothetical protein
MASNSEAGSRTFLAIVLAGIVLALVIAAYLMYGTRHETSVKMDQPAPSESAPPPAPAPGPEAAPQAAPPMAPETPAAPAQPPANNP